MSQLQRLLNAFDISVEKWRENNESIPTAFLPLALVVAEIKQTPAAAPRRAVGSNPRGRQMIETTIAVPRSVLVQVGELLDQATRPKAEYARDYAQMLHNTISEMRRLIDQAREINSAVLHNWPLPEYARKKPFIRDNPEAFETP